MVILRVVLFILAGICGVAAVVFFLRALGERVKASKKVFGVERQNMLQGMKLHALIGVGFLFLAMLLSGGAGLTFLDGSEEDVTSEDTTPIATVEGVEVLVEETPGTPVATTEVIPSLTPTNLPTQTPALSAPETPAPQPTDTMITSTVEVVDVVATPAVAASTAIVNSPVVGLYLRSTPSGEIIERLEDGVQVTLLGEEEVVDSIEWVTVSAPSGNQGWVATEYLQTVETVPTTSSDEGG